LQLDRQRHPEAVPDDGWILRRRVHQ